MLNEDEARGKLPLEKRRKVCLQARQFGRYRVVRPELLRCFGDQFEDLSLEVETLGAGELAHADAVSGPQAFDNLGADRGRGLVGGMRQPLACAILELGNQRPGRRSDDEPTGSRGDDIGGFRRDGTAAGTPVEAESRRRPAKSLPYGGVPAGVAKGEDAVTGADLLDLGLHPWLELLELGEGVTQRQLAGVPVRLDHEDVDGLPGGGTFQRCGVADDDGLQAAGDQRPLEERIKVGGDEHPEEGARRKRREHRMGWTRGGVTEEAGDEISSSLLGGKDGFEQFRIADITESTVLQPLVQLLGTGGIGPLLGAEDTLLGVAKDPLAARDAGLEGDAGADKDRISPGRHRHADGKLEEWVEGRQGHDGDPLFLQGVAVAAQAGVVNVVRHCAPLIVCRDGHCNARRRGVREGSL